ncbi:MAG: HGGxSTG domain-containing protein [Acidobacteriota bacterium]
MRSVRRPPRRDRPRCGAKTRTGQPYRMAAHWESGADHPRNGRRRLHGGLSTGPRSEAGRGASATPAQGATQCPTSTLVREVTPR